MEMESSKNPAGRTPSVVVTGAARVLCLQGIELAVDTPAAEHRSGNSVYTCLARSAFSMGC